VVGWVCVFFFFFVFFFLVWVLFLVGVLWGFFFFWFFFGWFGLGVLVVWFGVVCLVVYPPPLGFCKSFFILRPAHFFPGFSEKFLLYNAITFFRGLFDDVVGRREIPSVEQRVGLTLSLMFVDLPVTGDIRAPPYRALHSGGVCGGFQFVPFLGRFHRAVDSSLTGNDTVVPSLPLKV